MNVDVLLKLQILLYIIIGTDIPFQNVLPHLPNHHSVVFSDEIMWQLKLQLFVKDSL